MRLRFIPALLALCCFQTLVTAPVHGDLPVMIHLSETQPPTAEDWFRSIYRAQMRRECHTCQKCDSANCCVGPLVLWPEIVYYPCLTPPEPCPCEKAPLRGGYGILHPAPYYIPNPVLSVEMNEGRRCAPSHENWRFPNNRVELMLRTWE